MKTVTNSKIIIYWMLTVGVVLTGRLFAVVTGTAHDFSPAKDGSIACQFCHTPHISLPQTPLWNHKLSTAVYSIYNSSSLDAEVDQPTGSSKLCLSCHDGTIALEANVRGGSGTTYMPPGKTNISTDLSDDHPISFVYSADLAAKDPQLRSPHSLPEEIAMDSYGEMQCVTCHDPHDNTFGDFLVTTNIKSNLCLKCHNLYGWTETVHATSTALVQNADDEYLKNTGYATVSENGCLCCHQTHSAGRPERLFHFYNEEDNCLNCHNGKVASNLLNEVNNTSGHFVKNYEGIHDVNESIGGSEIHVECVDCHNPHTIAVRSAQAPYIRSSQKGVSGISAEGSVVGYATYEYEVCFKCHGNNPDRIESDISRAITQNNTVMEFDQSNPSSHPVVARGVGLNLPSLVPEMGETTMIYCTDCHNSDSSSPVKGPHGSQYKYLLAYRYETANDTEENAFAYELCYRCHDRDNILADTSFSAHKKHIVDERTPCSVCHDPHGISFVQGNSLNNSNLINFDISVVLPGTDGIIEFEDLGLFRGQCTLECHGKKHDSEDYRH